MRIRVCLTSHPVYYFDSLSNALDHIGKHFYVSAEARAEALQRLGALKTATLSYGFNSATVEFVDEGEPTKHSGA